MRVFAIADLHLGLGVNKRMDPFGVHWVRHHEKIEAAWSDHVGPVDLVLVAGDVSWACRTSDAVPDLDWLQRLPGTKVLVKGNHDFWWPKTHRKLAELLPPSVRPLDRDSLILGPVAIVGGRGADMEPPWAPVRKPDAEKALARELERLEESCKSLARKRVPPGVVRVAMLHFPPFPPNASASPFTDILEAAGVQMCVFGHLHTDQDFQSVFQGEVRGIRYFLTSSDYLDFKPFELPIPG